MITNCWGIEFSWDYFTMGAEDAELLDKAKDMSVETHPSLGRQKRHQDVYDIYCELYCEEYGCDSTFEGIKNYWFKSSQI